MPYVFGGLILVNAAVLISYLFFQQPSSTESLKQAQVELVNPIAFTNNSKYLPPLIGDKE
ncbi:hypothetical protein M0N77_10770 [Psychrobacter sp. AH5]|uniref:hypothetical protein n=1 Tax=Psychrobacter sp. AH5 TaxID=2937433 RepID=UPI003342526E